MEAAMSHLVGIIFVSGWEHGGIAMLTIPNKQEQTKGDQSCTSRFTH
jgi:hypothetical protein